MTHLIKILHLMGPLPVLAREGHVTVHEGSEGCNVTGLEGQVRGHGARNEGS